MDFELTYAGVACVPFDLVAVINGTLFVVAEQPYCELIVIKMCRKKRVQK